MSDLNRYLNAMVSHLNAGRAAEAEKMASVLVKNAPDTALGWTVLGAALRAQGRAADAVDALRRAVALSPSAADAHCNLGATLFDLQQFGAAQACFLHAVSLAPKMAEAHYFLGNSQVKLGMLPQAEATYRQAIELMPEMHVARYNLGNIVRDQGRTEAAEQIYLGLLKLAPNHAETLHNLGAIYQTQKKWAQAEAHFQRAIESKPDYADAYSNLGLLFKRDGRWAEAEAACRQAIALAGTTVPAETSLAIAIAHATLATVLRDQGRLEDAEKATYRVIEIALTNIVALSPDLADGHCNLGIFYAQNAAFDEAIRCYRRAIEIQPDLDSANSNLLFSLAYGVTTSPQAYLQEARQWEVRVLPESLLAQARSKVFGNAPRQGRKLRVGYLSGDFKQHAVSYFLETVLIHHDRSRVEIFAYSTADKADEVTVRLKALFDHWRDVALDNDAQICALIQGHRLDVLVDLSGHTGGNRMAVIARRAAPVQAHYLGYFASTGLTEMDYWIGDDVLLPPKANAHFSETPWRLSRVWVSYLAPDNAPPVLWQPAVDGTVWLGSFNNIAKLTVATFELWAKLLHALPQAKLLLKYKFLDEVGNLGRITSIFERCGIPADRLELRGETKGWAQHMALYNRLDIALDPVGAHAGVTTTCDALWMGVPVVSRVGDRMAQRQGASLLTAIGHPEWVAHDDADYIAKVAVLASDVAGRAALRPLQRETMRRSVLCDGKGLASALEDAYVAMFDTWWQLQTERQGKNE